MTKRKKVFKMVDLFCGAGGTSTGAARAIQERGLSYQLMAVNHWPVAIETHTLNHPEATHLCNSIDTINPRDFYEVGELDLLWASPECMNHSRARGSRPVHDQSRATAWCVTRWADAIQPKRILVENVAEFLDWAPLGTNGKPLKSRKGDIFRSWVNTLEAIGYRVDYRVLNSADYGDPQKRLRLFVQAVRGRGRIEWPEPTHFAVGDANLFSTGKTWVPAREIINWEHPSRSIYGRKKPLATNTLRRIQIGLNKFGIRPFIVPQQSRNEARSLEDPLTTITGRGAEALCEPFLVQVNYGNDVAPNRVSSIDEPLKTVLGTPKQGICEPFLVRVGHYGKDGNGAVQIKPVDEPLTTITTKQEHGLCQPFLVKVNHGGGDDRRVRDIEDPLPTVTTKGSVGLCEPYLVHLRGTADAQIEGSARSIDETLPTITAGGGHVALCEPFITPFYGNSGARPIGEPLDTVTCNDRFGLVMPVLEIAGETYRLDVRFRMLQPDELALAQGFPRGYRFAGTKTEQTKQIGNAVPCGLASALVGAILDS